MALFRGKGLKDLDEAREDPDVVSTLQREAGIMLSRYNPLWHGTLMLRAADEIVRLRSMVASLVDRVAAQSEIITNLSERCPGGEAKRLPQEDPVQAVSDV